MGNIDLVLNDYIDMIKKSWTYEKMSGIEKTRLLDMFDSIRTQDALKGTYNQRWQVLQAIYHAYLIGLGYDNFNWREDK